MCFVGSNIFDSKWNHMEQHIMVLIKIVVPEMAEL